MTFQLFQTRAASAWIAVLYLLLGLPMLLFPSLSGTVFVWILAAGAAAYGASHLWRCLTRKEPGQGSGSDLFLTILPLAFALFALLRPLDVLSFLPLVLGALLLVDGVGKAPLAIAAIREKSPALIPMMISALLPAALGVLLVINPFHAVRLVTMIFGLAMIADGISDLITVLLIRRTPTAGGSEQPFQTDISE